MNVIFKLNACAEIHSSCSEMVVNSVRGLCLQDHLTDLLDKCAHMLEKAERYELLGEIYRLIIPIFERKRDFPVRCFVFLTHVKKLIQDAGTRTLHKFFYLKF